MRAAALLLLGLALLVGSIFIFTFAVFLLDLPQTRLVFVTAIFLAVVVAMALWTRLGLLRINPRAQSGPRLVGVALLVVAIVLIGNGR